MSKEQAGDDLGLPPQRGFLTKALVGLFGSDRFRLAVSADGSTFFDRLSVDNATGHRRPVPAAAVQGPYQLRHLPAHGEVDEAWSEQHQLQPTARLQSQAQRVHTTSDISRFFERLVYGPSLGRALGGA